MTASTRRTRARNSALIARYSSELLTAWASMNSSETLSCGIVVKPVFSWMGSEIPPHAHSAEKRCSCPEPVQARAHPEQIAQPKENAPAVQPAEHLPRIDGGGGVGTGAWIAGASKEGAGEVLAAALAHKPLGVRSLHARRALTEPLPPVGPAKVYGVAVDGD